MSSPIFRSRCLAAAALVFLAASCTGDGRTIEAGSVSVTLGADGVLEVRQGGLPVAATHAEGPTVEGDETRRGAAYAGFAVAHTEDLWVDELYGFFDFQKRIGPWTRLTPGEPTVVDGRLRFDFLEGGGGEVAIGDDGTVHVSFTAPRHLGDRLAMSLPCTDDERIFGGGAQVAAEHRGWRIPFWTQEQGVGKADRGARTPLFGVAGNFYDAYAPVPFALTSRPLGLWLEGTHRSELEACEDERALRFEIAAPRFDLHLFPSETMAGALEAFTARTGRPDPSNRWTFAPWIDTFGGPGAIEEALGLLREHDVPASALWAEDWVGLVPFFGENLAYDWEEDPTLYPDLADTARAVHEAGLRYLVYFNPFVPIDTNVYRELGEAGALVVDEDGEEIIVSFPFGAPPAYFDPTAEAGIEILHHYFERAVDRGVDGWMADYGEALPYEAVLADGRTGAEAHNDYPLMWAEANKRWWDARRPDGDYAIFSRAGFTGIAARTHIHWLGDQLASFDRNDGFGSVVPLYLSAGLSGIAHTHSDVGGYSATPAAVRTFELWARWLAFEAFTPILRTHHTSAPDDAVQWSTDEATLALFRRYARWHQRLVPYFVGLANEATARGHPTVRPIWWGAEDRVDLLDVADQVLVGPDLLLAPVTEAGATGRDVVLPPGAWRRWPDLWADLGPPETGGSVHAEAPVGETVLYVRAGAALPLLADEWDTLAPDRPGRPGAAPDVRVAPASLDRLRLLLVAGGDGEGRVSGYSLPDASWRFEGTDLVSGPLAEVRVGGVALPACAGATATDCVEDGVARLGGPEAFDGTEIEIVAAGGRTGRLTVSGPGLVHLNVALR